MANPGKGKLKITFGGGKKKTEAAAQAAAAASDSDDEDPFADISTPFADADSGHGGEIELTLALPGSGFGGGRGGGGGGGRGGGLGAAGPESPTESRPDASMGAAAAAERKTPAKKGKPVRQPAIAPLLETALRLRVMFERMVANWIVHVDAPPVGRLVYSDTDLKPVKPGKAPAAGRGGRGGGRAAARASRGGRGAARGRGAKKPRKSQAGAVERSPFKQKKLSKARQHQLDCAQRLKDVWSAVCDVTMTDGHRCADIFMELPGAKDVPGYYETIRAPMSLRNVETKCDSFFYNDDDHAFAKDMSLIFANARQFNPPGNFVVNDADKCEAVFKTAFGGMPARPAMGGEGAAKASSTAAVKRKGGLKLSLGPARGGVEGEEPAAKKQKP